MKIGELTQAYEMFCPKSLALFDDPVGLQIGDLNQEVKKVLVTLDIREQVVDEAIKLGVDLIFAKHPVIFSPLSALTTTNPQEHLVWRLARANIAVYTSHTNIDVVAGGLNDDFASLLDLTEVRALDDENQMGRIGEVEPIRLSVLTEKVKAVFGRDRLRVVTYDHTMNQVIRRIAICGGTGGKLWPLAVEKKADLLITGDIYYHTAHDFLSQGLVAIDPGHYIEHLFIPKIAKLLRTYNDKLEVFESQVSTNPFYDI